jgi:putative transposase
MLSLTYEYRIYPSADQEATMLNWLEHCRRVFNFGLRERKDWIRSRKCDINACSIHSEYIISADAPKPTYIRQQNALTKYRQTSPELQTVHSQVLQGALRQLDEAFKNMWERGFGFPRFKKPGRMRSFVFPQLGKNPVGQDTLKFPIFGWVKAVLHRPIPDGFKIKQARIVKRAAGWYVMLSLEMDVSVPDIKIHGHAIGIDLGLNAFAATSDGELIARPRFFVDLQREMKLLQRRLKHKKKGSQNWLKLQRKIGRLHQQISNTRKDYHFKTANHLCDNAETIFAEDLNLKAMSKGMLCKHTLDAGFGQFLHILAWVCWKRGVYFGKVDPNGTSQTCPRCDAHVNKDLGVRIHSCPECGYITDRDVAAAQVIVKRGISAVGHTVDKLPAEGFGLGDPMKQENPESDLWKPALYC